MYNVTIGVVDSTLSGTEVATILIQDAVDVVSIDITNSTLNVTYHAASVVGMRISGVTIAASDSRFNLNGGGGGGHVSVLAISAATVAHAAVAVVRSIITCAGAVVIMRRYGTSGDGRNVSWSNVTFYTAAIHVTSTASSAVRPR